MRLAMVRDQAMLVTGWNDEGVCGVDVNGASHGEFGPSVAEVYARWSEFAEWARTLDVEAAGRDHEIHAPLTALGNPSPSPRQVFAIGLNYADHAAEAGHAPERAVVPSTFTKFPTSLSAPFAPVQLTGATVDWEIELVAVIGRRAQRVSVADAWSHVAGLTVGQDYSDRTVQSAGPAPQFSLGKSAAGFGPMGPWLVTVDEFADPDDLELICEINGEQVQKGRSSAMVWSVPELISVLSGICPLLPGDVVFTGTPAGVGAARTPARFLSAGDVVISKIAGIGEIRQLCMSAVIH